jgi:tetratricopeptide (TPR) repeat protein
LNPEVNVPPDLMRVRDVFLAAAELPSQAARIEFLERECGADVDLRARVEELLRAHDQRGASLLGDDDATAGGATTSPADPVDSALTSRAEPTDAARIAGAETAAPISTQPKTDTEQGTVDPVAPTQAPRPTLETATAPLGPTARVIAGRYELVEILGEGGMGTVYRARQTEPVKRDVALKLIRTGMDSKTVVARFDSERQALALMDHPNIARVFDGGVTTEGQPFFVMELVRGVPITQFCDDRRLTPESRLELFIPVCLAVQHAHQKGVIHRDLKPTNVLVAEVDGRPTPKVIDFGVAKATEQRLTDLSLADTGAIVGTPTYMSPEQADPSSMDIDTRTDVYALGVMLYELLTGSTPIDARQFRRGAVLEMLRMVREVEPLRPSTRVSTADDLPNIAVNRAVEPAQLLRWLRGDIDWIVMKALEKDRERRYETANGFAADIRRYLAHEPVVARPPSRGYRLRKFVRRNRGLVTAACLLVTALLAGFAGTAWGLVRAQRARDAETHQRIEAERAQTAEAEQRRLAERARTTAESKEAETAAVLSFVEQKIFAAARPEGLAGGISKDVTLRAAIEKGLEHVAKSFTNQPLIEARLRQTLGTSFYFLGELNTALAQREISLALYKERLGPDHPDTWTAMHNLASAYQALGRDAEALKLHEQTLALRRSKLGPDHRDTVTSIHSVAVDAYGLGRYSEALKNFEELVPLRRAQLGPDHADTLAAMTNLAVCYGAVGRQVEGARLNEEILSLRRSKLGPGHPDTLLTMHNLAWVYWAMGRYAEAYKLVEETLAGERSKLGANHPLTLMTLSNAAAFASVLGRYAEAHKLFEEALALKRSKLGPDHPETLRSMSNLAGSLGTLDRHAEALELDKETLALRKSELGPDHPDTLYTMDSVARTLAILRRYPEALKLGEETLALRRSKLGPDHRNTLISMCSLASIYWDLGRHTEAVKLYEDTLALQRSKLAPGHHDTLSTMAGLADTYRALGRNAEALKLHEETLALRRSQLGPEHPETLSSMNDVAQSEYALNRHAEALALREKTLALRRAQLGTEHSDTLQSAWKLAESLVHEKRGTEAVALIDETVKLARGKSLDSKLISGVMDLRLRHFMEAKDAAGCRDTAQMWEKLARTDAGSLYSAACFRAVTARLLKDRPGDAKAEADRAMAWLKQAVAAGFKDRAQMEKDSDLDALRARDDFKALLDSVARKTK